MYENGEGFWKELLSFIIAIIIFFFIVPWLLDLGSGSSTPKRQLGTYENYDGAWPR